MVAATLTQRIREAFGGRRPILMVSASDLHDIEGKQPRILTRISRLTYFGEFYSNGIMAGLGVIACGLFARNEAPGLTFRETTAGEPREHPVALNLTSSRFIHVADTGILPAEGPIRRADVLLVIARSVPLEIYLANPASYTFNTPVLFICRSLQRGEVQIAGVPAAAQ